MPKKGAAAAAKKRDTEPPLPRGEFAIWWDRTFGRTDDKKVRNPYIGMIQLAFFVIICFSWLGIASTIALICYLIVRPIGGVRRAQSCVDAITETFHIYQAVMFEYYVNCPILLYGDPIPMRENAFVISNHQWVLDWSVLFSVGLRKGMSGAGRFFSKKSVFYIPGLGLGVWMSGSVFLERNWEKDRASIDKAFRRLRTLTPPHPLWMITFPESTRITPEKRALSHDYARENGLPLYENLLVPRTKGFVAQVKGLREVVPALYDLTICYGSTSNEPPSLMDLACGKYDHPVHIHCQRFEMADLPESNADLREWIFKRWEEKDALITYCRKNGRFPGPKQDDPFAIVPVWKKSAHGSTVTRKSKSKKNKKNE